jgi:hypothetical protein
MRAYKNPYASIYPPNTLLVYYKAANLYSRQILVRCSCFVGSFSIKEVSHCGSRAGRVEPEAFPDFSEGVRLFL